MTVRSHVPLGWRIAIGVGVVAASVAAGALLVRFGVVGSPRVAADPAAARAVDENRALRAERDALRQSQGAVTDSGLVMERATIAELGQQISRLEADNARLKEDVAFFEAATADRAPGRAIDAASGIAIRRFQMTQDPQSGVWRYRVLLTQDSRATREFVGRLQFAITALQDGAPVAIAWPRADAGSLPGADEAKSSRPPAARPGVTDAARSSAKRATTGALAGPDAPSSSAFDVVFRSYKRIDGSFELPDGVAVQSVQARILERGVVRVQQTVTVGK